MDVALALTIAIATIMMDMTFKEVSLEMVVLVVVLLTRLCATQLSHPNIMDYYSILFMFTLAI